MVNNNLEKLSQSCIGCEPLGGVDHGNLDIVEVKRTIRLALDQNINFFDVADTYGLGEAEINLSKTLGSKIKDVFVATKIGVRWEKSSHGRAKTYIDNDPKYLKKALDGSLLRLKLSQIPLCYLHWPSTDINEFLRGVEQLCKFREQGLICNVGISNVNEVQLSKALQVGQIDFVQLPVNILDKKVSTKMQELFHLHKIRLVAYNILANGLLSGKYSKYTKFSSNDRRSRISYFCNYDEIADKIQAIKKECINSHLTMPQFSIKNLIDSYKSELFHVIIGVKSQAQLEENMKAIDKI